MRIQTVPCLNDNLSYLVIDEPSRTCVIIDPSEARPFLDVIKAQDLTLHAIMTTHHHHDHIGGLKDLPEVPVWSSKRDLERIPGAGPSGSRTQRRTFPDGRTLSWSELGNTTTPTANSEIQIQAVSIPGHTEGQIAILVSNPHSSSEPHVFVGDTLFEMGCGRCIEGTPEELFKSLQLLKTLPAGSHVYFGHEYTEKNALFWLHHANELDTNTDGSFKIDSEGIRSALAAHRRLTEAGSLPKPPPKLQTEVARNPFLQIKNASDFRHWRQLRNQF